MQLQKAFALISFAASTLSFLACGDTDSRIGKMEAPVDGEPCSAPGETQPADDGCNECTCTGDSWACTDIACGSSGSTCEYAGREYADGESFPCTDGCNTCFCEDGQVGGTLIGCPEDGGLGPSTCVVGGIEYEDGESFRCDCNQCTCVGGLLHTTTIACNPETPSGRSCLYGDVMYSHDDTFPCTDGCNTCWCNDGEIGSTMAFCGAGDCTYNGVHYQHGETFPALDGCNQCDCADGVVSCTDAACASPCALPAESGPCFAAMTRFYFDSGAGECLPFTYGGCSGNANNFVTVDECQQACPPGAD